jgi:hypothetical protein
MIYTKICTEPNVVHSAGFSREIFGSELIQSACMCVKSETHSRHDKFTNPLHYVQAERAWAVTHQLQCCLASFEPHLTLEAV